MIAHDRATRPRHSVLAARALAATLVAAMIVAVLATRADSAANDSPNSPLPVAQVAGAIEDQPPEPVLPGIETAQVIAPPPVAAIRVADPRPGDMRFDTHADALPLHYKPGAPAQEMHDVAYGPDAAHRLDIRLPLESHAPVILFLHAGGWVGGGREFVPDLVLRFVERGYAVVSVGYHLAPAHPFPEPIEDVKRAIRWLKVYGRDSGTIDGDRIVLAGASAGGHLASITAATPGLFEPSGLSPDEQAVDSSVTGIVSMVGPTDLVELYRHDHPWAGPLTKAFVGCDPCTAAQLEVASTRSYLHSQLPPAYWAYGQDDALVSAAGQGETIADEWAAVAGAGTSWIDVVEGAGHNLDESTVNLRQLDEFVDDAVGASAPPQD